MEQVTADKPFSTEKPEVVEILDEKQDSDDAVEVVHTEFSSRQEADNDQISKYYSKTPRNDMRHAPVAWQPNQNTAIEPVQPLNQGPMASMMTSHYTGAQTFRQPNPGEVANLTLNVNSMQQSYNNMVTSQQPRAPLYWQENWDLSTVTVPDYMGHSHCLHTPRWDNILPQNLHRMFELNILNMSEFQITERLPDYNPIARIPLTGLRKMIRQMSKGHGQPVFEQAYTGMEGLERAPWMDRPARWRVPLGCYHQLYTWICATGAKVQGIALEKLNSASVSKARAEKKAPSVQGMVKLGVPFELAECLAPYQRAGVAFIHEKAGRALLADEMGLGKTVQSIAACSIYVDEWPLLVICPAGAKFHWETEFLYWLGAKSQIYASNSPIKDDGICFPMLKKVCKDKHKGKLLKKSDIKIFESLAGRFDSTKYKVVIASYSIATRLIEERKIKPSMFKIIVADESHNLKNYKSKRTKLLLPLLQSTKRCILISGTPSLAKPKELLPQLEMLRPSFKEQFKERYCSKNNNFELHMFLTSECMIRRLKNQILKDLPPKQRELVNITIKDKDFQRNWNDLYERFKQLKKQTGAGRQQNAFMFQLYQITGRAKVPLIVKELEKFLSDPSSGKVCIFAHHTAVLNDIEEAAIGFSNNKSSVIRIDGSVNCQTRRERILAFQTDPTVRVALLGICAASVCVSLTASSTVWFAELFWTPSIMLQAEDRCHRIGQRATVKCKYFWAKGTMDDTVWQMIKRKYENLGEYVDGITTTFAIHGDGEVTSSDDNEDSIKKEGLNVVTKKEFLSEAKEFQAEEIAELKLDEDSTDDSEETDKPSAVKKEITDEDEEIVETKCKVAEKSHTGASSAVAICLSDEDDVGDDEDASTESKEEYPAMRVFKMTFPGPTFGLVLVPHRGRAIVHQRTTQRITDLGRNVKPHVGDILVSIDNFPILTSTPFHEVLGYMKKKLLAAPVELWFAEDEGFAKYYKKEVRFKFANHAFTCEDDSLPSKQENEATDDSIVPTVINLMEDE